MYKSSHPSWVRGLKQVLDLFPDSRVMSHPSWVRGLKLSVRRTSWLLCVAPLVGAWIETLAFTLFDLEYSVAPLVGAWIETLIVLYNKLCSHVAPLVGAWIETTSRDVVVRGRASHPSWVRGLKLKSLIPYLILKLSRTPRGCVD